MSRSAVVIDLDAYRRRKAMASEPKAAPVMPCLAVVWVPCWLWVAGWTPVPALPDA